MALLTSEIDRCRLELGYNLLNAGAEPYIGVHAIFDQIVAVYLRTGASTTSVTVVAAADAATPAAITLASATGFDVHARVVIDVDDRQEVATVQSISGSVITVLLRLAHTGTYPITVEGGETMIREQLKELRRVQQVMLSVLAQAGLKRAEEIEWYQSANGGSSQVQSLNEQRDYYRDQLASALGVANLRKVRQQSSLAPVLY